MPAPDRVVGIGQATVDQLAVGPRSVESVVEMHRFSIQAGGAVGTALATVCAFGGQARYVGRLSDDEFGQIILRGLKDFGVDTSQVLIEPGKISPASFIMVDERTGRRTGPLHPRQHHPARARRAAQKSVRRGRPADDRRPRSVSPDRRRRTRQGAGHPGAARRAPPGARHGRAAGSVRRRDRLRALRRRDLALVGHEAQPASS